MSANGDVEVMPLLSTFQCSCMGPVHTKAPSVAASIASAELASLQVAEAPPAPPTPSVSPKDKARAEEAKAQANAAFKGELPAHLYCP